MTSLQIAALTWLLQNANNGQPIPAEISTRTLSALRGKRSPFSHSARLPLPAYVTLKAGRYELTELGRQAAERLVANPPAAKAEAPRAVCQLCEREQALKGSGHLVHHGYKRPGWGFIVGDCMGAGRLPFPATDALEEYLPLVIRHAEHAEREAANPSGYTFQTGYKPRAYGQRSEATHETVQTFEQYSARCAELVQTAEPSIRGWFYSFDTANRWDRLVKSTKAKWAAEASNARAEQARVVARIAKGRELRGA